MKPVLYLMEQTGVDNALEAYDTLFFCSHDCRAIVAANTEHTVKAGESAEYIAGTVCDECGKPLESGAPHNGPTWDEQRNATTVAGVR